MTRELLTGNAAAAWGARLADVDYVPAYPITPQTEIIETLARWVAAGDMPARLVTMDSEHSMLTAAGAAAAVGARVFTASSSQGLLYAMEMLYSVAGWRVPMVLVNVSRAVAAPITLEPDHNDVLAARDSGFLQIHAETCQEVLDSILMAYRLSEHADVLLPAIVNLDGFYLSFTREPIEVPSLEEAREFLPSRDPRVGGVSASHTVAQGVAVLASSAYSFFKYQMHLASEAVIDLHAQVAAELAARFGRSYGVVDEYCMGDAEWVLVSSNSFSTTLKAEVRRLRERGERVGLLRLRVVRPFPHAQIARCLAGRRAVAVIDQNISVGKGGVFFSEIASAMVDRASPPLMSFVGGLGGRRFRPDDIDDLMVALRRAEVEGGSSAPHLMYTHAEHERMLALLAAAGHGTAGGPDGAS